MTTETPQEAPAEVMRRAAKLMRERTPDTGDSRWAVRDGSGGLPIVVLVPPGASPAEWTIDVAYAEDRFAEHIASWNPLVAAAVADWLQFEAASAPDGPDQVYLRGGRTAHALAVARAYLGEPS
jgi:hypothetical protein